MIPELKNTGGFNVRTGPLGHDIYIYTPKTETYFLTLLTMLHIILSNHYSYINL